MTMYKKSRNISNRIQRQPLNSSVNSVYVFFFFLLQVMQSVKVDCGSRWIQSEPGVQYLRLTIWQKLSQRSHLGQECHNNSLKPEWHVTHWGTEGEQAAGWSAGNDCGMKSLWHKGERGVGIVPEKEKENAGEQRFSNALSGFSPTMFDP